ncbi:precorrin-2 C(20)-methyltransferase [Rhodobacteraceae bacterium 2CG4]|uniref:Precorrin-2 C(20)-methyltransferase n=1 Tax=Halovulum marinum TaxID=2662447 RepID=A0A6L5Z3Q0_9RHOB|nr:precorrin-2 C(20)-methyltransferase [Halovulum marinum]MSU90710.1 precorrin-2 C(20)-methyltransferase [Halovulum marinum]
MSGTLYGVGVGPGDPELLTLKAHRLISSAVTVAYPAPDSGASFARSIVAAFIPKAAREIPIVIPMRSERFPAQAIYDRAADEIAEALQHGDVVVLCEGDPFFYGSFMYLFARLAGRTPVRIVPGVTSMTACAAAVQRPLCARNEVLSALPATLPDDELRALIARPGALAIMKVGRHLPRVRALLAEAGLERRAAFVSHASLPHQQAMPLAEAPDTAPYFSMILVPGDDPHAGS